jgi:hypothetical protein
VSREHALCRNSRFGREAGLVTTPLPTGRASSQPTGLKAARPTEREVSAAALNRSVAHDASDEHSGAEVRSEHRPHLRAEQRTRAEDLGALSDQMLGVFG